tara:strand:+ start:259 stop:396 length:138 start_codon:yes stop_codon:yes gene_type:complete
LDHIKQASSNEKAKQGEGQFTMTDIKKDGEDEIPGYAGLSDQKVI